MILLICILHVLSIAIYIYYWQDLQRLFFTGKNIHNLLSVDDDAWWSFYQKHDNDYMSFLNGAKEFSKFLLFVKANLAVLMITIIFNTILLLLLGFTPNEFLTDDWYRLYQIYSALTYGFALASFFMLKDLISSANVIALEVARNSEKMFTKYKNSLSIN